MGSTDRACVVSIEVDGRQRLIFQADSLQERLGASRLIDRTVQEAEHCFGEEAGCPDLHLLAPVSGEIRAWAPLKCRNALLSASWRFREWLDDHDLPHSVAYLECDARHLTNEKGDGDTPDDPNSLATKVHRDMADRMRTRKDAKADEDARPRCALFAPCGVLGAEPAIQWDPEATGPQGGRRRLRGRRADVLVTAWADGREKLFDSLRTPLHDWLKEKYGLDLPSTRKIDFHQWVERIDEAGGDSYIAYACADGDGMGAILAGLDWNSPAWGDRRAPWERNAAFVREYDQCVKDAFRDAVIRVLAPDKDAAQALVDGKRLKFPLLPQLLGGDDLWMVGGRKAVLDVGLAFIKRYEELATRSPTLAKALEVSNQQRKARLTISMGLVFAKATHPADAMVETAEELMRSAKALRKQRVWGRKGEADLEGCIDWHWVTSSKGESVEDARAAGWRYESGTETLLLTTRPWTAKDSGRFIDAARRLTRPRDGIPRRKREQWESILRMGRKLGGLAFEAWWKGLTAGQRKAFDEACCEGGCLPPRWQLGPGADKIPDPWKPLGESKSSQVFATPLLDLLSLQDVLADSQGDEGDWTDEPDGAIAPKGA